MSHPAVMASTKTADTQTITVTAYAGSADVDITASKVRPQYWAIENPSTTLDLLVSLDGTTDHGRLGPSQSRTFKWANEKKLWFKLSSAGSTAVVFSAMPSR